MVICVNGKKIDVKEYGCAVQGLLPIRIPPSVNIFTKVTSSCQAHCPFCSNAGYSNPKQTFDIDKLASFIKELEKGGVKVNKVNITGGEPSIISSLIERILDRFTSDSLLSRIHLHLNTNGLSRSSQELMRNSRWDSISVSLHHYNKARLSELYGFPIEETAMVFEGIDQKKMNVSCNLIRGYIDSTEEVRKMLDFAIEKGITRIGFVSLMKINKWCEDHFIRFDDLSIESIPHIYFTRRMDRGEDCCCSNYLYNKNMRVLEIYHRNYSNYQYCESSLVYDGEFFRQGFHSDSIVW